MAVRDVVLYPDDPLTKKAEPIAEFGDSISELVADMFETMYAYDGIGLAGPQVGISQRILTLCEPESYQEMCLINPEILSEDGREIGEEGCLSLPNVYAMVPRATKIRVRAQDSTGEISEFDAEGLLARIILHEYDHLDGIVFPDRLDILSREDTLAEWEKVRQGLGAGVRKG